VVVVVVVHAVVKSTAGVVFAATSLFLIAVTVARLGSPTGLVYFLVRARTRGRADTMRRILRIGLAPVVLGSLVVAGVLAAASPVVARWIVPGDATAAVLPLRVLALLVPVAAVSDTLLMGSRGFNTMRPLILVERIARPIGQVLLTLVAILVGAKTAVALTSAWALPYVATAAVAVWWTAGLLRRVDRRHVHDLSMGSAPADPERSDGVTTAREYWVFTAPRALQSVVQIALQRLDIVLVSALIGPKEAAVYAAVTRFLVFGQLGAQAITAAVQPQLGARLFSGDIPGAGKVYQVSTCWLILLTWPVYLSLAVFSRQIPAFFGHGYDAGTAVLVILGCAMLVATGAGLVDVVLAMAGRTTWTLGNSVLALVVDVTLNLILLPRIGIKGAAIAWAAAIVCNNVLPVTQLAVSMRLHPFGRGTLLAMTSAGAWLGLLPTMASVVFGASAVVLVTAMVLGLAGYVLTAWRLRTVFEIDALLRATRRRVPPASQEVAWR
jgi:O-antigen/teichoic acid export membrane protein